MSALPTLPVTDDVTCDVSNEHICDEYLARQNRYLNAKEIAAQSEILKSMPVIVNLPAGSKCNLRCVFCTDRSENPPFDYKHLSYQDMVNLLSFTERASAVGLYGWGEPLFNPAYQQAVEYLTNEKPSLFLHITSNGVLLDDRWRQVLLNKNHISLNISVNAVGSESYKKLMGFDFFNTVRDNITSLVEGINGLGNEDVYVSTSMVFFARIEQNDSGRCAASMVFPSLFIRAN